MKGFKKLTSTTATAPNEDLPELPNDSVEQEDVVEVADTAQTTTEAPKISPQKPSNQRIVHVPVYLSQDQINNMVIENNLMLKEILANISVE